MTIPQPDLELQDQACQLVGEIEAAKEDGETAGLEFRINRLLAMIKEIEKKDSVNGYSLWGAYYTILRNPQKANECFAMSLSIGPKSGAVHANYAISLAIFKDYVNSIKYFTKAVELDPMNMTFLTSFMSVAKLNGDEKLYKNLLERYKSLTANNIDEDEFSTDELAYVSCGSDSFSDWETDEEEEAWKHLQ